MIYFRGGAVRHVALAHNGLYKFLAEMSEEMGLYDDFKNLVLQGVIQDDNKPQSVAVCELCNKEFVKEHLKTHQILKHYLLNYSEEVTQFHTQRGAGNCPVFDCQVVINDLDHYYRKSFYQFQADSTKAGGAKMKMLSLHFAQKHLPLSLMKRTMFATEEDTIPCPFINSLTLRPCSKRFIITNSEDIKYLSHHVFAHIPDLVPVKAHQFHELSVNIYPVKSLEGCPLPFCNSKLCVGPDHLHKHHPTELAVFILSTIAGPESVLISSVVNLLVEFRRNCLLSIIKNQVPILIQEPKRISSRESTANIDRRMSNTEELSKIRKQEDNRTEPETEQLVAHQEPELNSSKPAPVPEESNEEETQSKASISIVDPAGIASFVRLTDIAYNKKWNTRVCYSWKRFMMEQSDEYLKANFNFLSSRLCKVPNCDFRAHNCAALMKHIRDFHAK